MTSEHPEELVETWITREWQDPAERTVEKAERYLSEYLEWCEENGQHPSEVTAWEAEGYLMDELDGYAEVDVVNRRNTLISFYNFLLRNPSISVAQTDKESGEDNPYRATSQGQITSGKDSQPVTRADKSGMKRYLEWDEMDDLFAAIGPKNELRNKLLVAVIYTTGIRLGEAVSIRIPDIDRDKTSIKVIEEKKSSGDSESHDRTVYYRAPVEELLAEWLDRGGRRKYGTAYDSNYLLITHHDRGDPHMSKKTAGRVIREAGRDAGLQETYEVKDGREFNRVTPHALRRTAAIHSIKNGMDLSFVSDMLGHDSVETTKDSYLEFVEEDHREAHNAYGPDALGGSNPLG